jgi:hypothetical protein
MADLIIVHEVGSNEPILLNCAAILKGREHNDPAHGIYISLELIADQRDQRNLDYHPTPDEQVAEDSGRKNRAPSGIETRSRSAVHGLTL